MKIATALVFCFLTVSCATNRGSTSAVATVWKLTRVDSVGGLAPQISGAPKARRVDGREALCFDGKADGLMLPRNPLEGWGAFTIEVLLEPHGDGPQEQRFLHIQDDLERRVLMETRVDPARTWALDTFLRATDADKLTLLDRARTSQTDRWYWAALVYDGRTMSHYVDGMLQLQGTVAFPPMVNGRISLGVRQNLVSWFKGCLAEVRFSPLALAPAKLRRPD